MKILVIAPYCFGLERSLVRGFERQGSTVQSIFYGEFQKENKRIKQKLFELMGYGWLRPVRKMVLKIGLFNLKIKKDLNVFNKELLKLSDQFKPDVVFIVKGDVVLPRVIDTLKKNSKLIAYYWDDPFLRFAEEITGGVDFRIENARNNVAQYDSTFVYDPSYVHELELRGAKNCHFLMDWYEPEIYKPISLSSDDKSKYGADVSFVGSPYENRVKLLVSLKDFNLGIWGPLFRWKEFFSKYPFIEKSYRGESPGEISAKIYNSSKIVLNIHDTYQCKESVNNRTFQILACGAFELVDDRPKIHELFRLGTCIDVFSSQEELRSKVDFYLNSNGIPNSARIEGPRLASNHSVDSRVCEMITKAKIT